MENNQKILKIYVDNCVFSGLAKNEMGKKLLESLEVICDSNHTELVGSKILLEEFSETKQDNTRVLLKFFYKLIKKIKYNPVYKDIYTWSGGLPVHAEPADKGHIEWSGGLPIVNISVVETELFLELKKIFKLKDAKHIYQSVKENCDFFMTLDKKTILNKAKHYSAKLKNSCPNLKFIEPEELANIIISFE